jgi:hypothetical protein
MNEARILVDVLGSFGLLACALALLPRVRHGVIEWRRRRLVRAASDAVVWQ